MNTKNSLPNPVNQLPSTQFFRSLMNKKLALCAAVLAASLGSASATFTYNGGNIDAANIVYDGCGVDSTVNPYTIGTSNDGDYIQNGGTLTVLCGTLTINCDDFKVVTTALTALSF
jgi:hypothetical protein